MAQLADDETLPPLIASSAAQSGVAFARAQVSADLDEPAPSFDESEPDRPLSALAVSQDSSRKSPLTPIRVADLDDDDDDDLAPAGAVDDDDDADSGDSMIAPVRLAPPPSEPLRVNRRRAGVARLAVPRRWSGIRSPPTSTRRRKRMEFPLRRCSPR